MPRKNIVIIVLYTVVLAAGITVIVATDRKASHVINKIPVEQAVETLKGYYPELKVYPKVAALKAAGKNIIWKSEGDNWVIVFYISGAATSVIRESHCFRVYPNGTFVRVGQVEGIFDSEGLKFECISQV